MDPYNRSPSQNMGSGVWMVSLELPTLYNGSTEQSEHYLTVVRGRDGVAKKIETTGLGCPRDCRQGDV